MSDQLWPANEEHPPLEALLLHLEGELEGRESAALARHLKDCWVCRAQCERLAQGICDFVHYHEEVLLPGVPPPPASRGRFSQRLQQEARRKMRHEAGTQIIRRVGQAVPRTVWVAAGAVAAMLALVVLLPVTQPPTMAAAEFLARARSSENAQAAPRPGRVIYQRVQIRRGDVVIERTLHRGDAGLAKAAEPLPDPETRKALDAARINCQNPLNVDDFADWRAAQPDKRDAVIETSNAVTLRTSVPGDAPVRAASLTVNQSDWRPIHRRVEFRNQPAVEVSELSFEVREIPVTRARVEEAPRLTPPALPALPEAAPEPAPTAADPEESELRLREALHGIRADVQEAPEIWRAGGEIQFRAWTDNPERREEIRRATEGIPQVAEAPQPAPIASPDANTAGETQQLTAPYVTHPPLAGALRDYLGGLIPMNNYLDEVRDGYLRLLVESSALERLGGRYPQDRLGELTTEEQTRVARIAADYIAKVRSEAARYLPLLLTVLDEMAQRNGLSASVDELAAPCAAWQDQAGLLVKDLQRLQEAFSRLFVADQVTAPAELSAGALLVESGNARAAVRRHLKKLCTP